MLQLNKMHNYTTAPASEAQKQLWLATKMRPEPWHYNIVMAYYIHGKVHPYLLEEAAQQLVDQHAILRTNFKLNDHGILEQVIHTKRKFHLQQDEDVPANFSLREKINQAVKTHFDLEAGMLFQMELVHLKNTKYVLILARHHLISDGWSSNIISQKISNVYNALLQNAPLLHLPPHQFSEYCAEEKAYLDSELFPKQLQALQKTLSETPKTSQEISPRFEGKNSTASIETLRFSEELLQLIRTQKENLNVSTNAILYSIFALLISNIFNRKECIISIPFSGRVKRKFDSTIGNFVNTLPLSVTIDTKQSFRDFVLENAKKILDLQALQKVPFSKISKEVSPFATRAIHPYLEFIFAQQIALRTPLVLGRARIHCIYHGNHLAQIAKLWMEVFQSEHGIYCKMHYRKNIFDGKAAKQITKTFISMALQYLQDIDQPLEPLASDANINPSPFPFISVQTSIENIAKTHPDRIAIQDQKQTLTYAMLNQKANQVAHYLLSKNISANDVVAILLPRSVQFVVCVLACLKIRASYTPISISHPKKHIDFIFQNSGAKLLIEDMQKTSSQTSPSTIIDAETLFSEAQKFPTTTPKIAALPTDIAYIIYTSGTTGTPKGVRIPHQNLAALLASTKELYPLTANDVVAMCHSVAFDFSVWEMFSALYQGATLRIFLDEEVKNREVMLQTILEEVSVLNQTPSSLNSLALYLEKTSPEILRKCKLRLIILGGESVNFTLLKPWIETFKQQKLEIYNMYGITEGTVHCTYLKVQESMLTDTCSLIGKPLPGIEIAVLDETQQPVSPGTIGEIYIGGYCVANGYHHQPQITSQQFKHLSIPGFFSTFWLKTGDLGKMHADGIEYFGRSDRQVKVRGFRIECPHVEKHILSYPGVKFAYVTATTCNHDDKRLVAYVMGNLTSEKLNTLKSYLFSVIPDYMVPSHIAAVDTIPLTSNGKVDVSALPPIGFDSKRDTSQNGTTLQQVTKIWKKVINTDHIDVHSNFFDNGGDSLLIAKLHMELSKTFACKISMIDLFTYPTIAQQAKYIHKKQEES